MGNEVEHIWLLCFLCIATPFLMILFVGFGAILVANFCDVMKKIKKFFKNLKNLIVDCAVALAIVELLAIIAIVGGPKFLNTFGSDVLKSPYEFINKYGKDILEKNNPISNQKDSSKELSEYTISNSESNKGDIKNEYEKSAAYSYNVVNTISGIATPLFSLLAVIAAFWTLYRQRKQNELAEFENHLFQMIDQQHKLEDKIIDKHGSFRELYEQFCCIYNKVYEEYAQRCAKSDLTLQNTKENLLKISYYIFYFGVDENFRQDKTDETVDKNYHCMFKILNEVYFSFRTEDNKHIEIFHNQKSEELGIYYRNLFNAIRYIDWSCPDENKKNEYARMVRTNISDFAQLMLYYNMQGKRGEAWLKGKQKDEGKEEVMNPKDEYDCLLTRYKPIKNCAISAKNKEIDPRNDSRKEIFSDGVIDYELKIAPKDKC